MRRETPVPFSRFAQRTFVAATTPVNGEEPFRHWMQPRVGGGNLLPPVSRAG